jgi:hypothetical protein
MRRTESSSTMFDRFTVMVLVMAAIFLISALIISCKDDDENYLEGSITSAYNMSFDSVRIRLYPYSALSIEYVKKSDSGDKIPLRITIDQSELQLSSGKNYDLTTTGSIGRGVGYDSMPLPTLTTGTIHLSSFGTADGSGVSGDFEAVFTGTNGKKLNLNGGFSGNLDRVE